MIEIKNSSTEIKEISMMILPKTKCYENHSIDEILCFQYNTTLIKSSYFALHKFEIRIIIIKRAFSIIL